MQVTNQYQALGHAFSRETMPAHAPKPELLLWNKALADELNLQADNQTISQYFSGTELINGSNPIAMAYAGHQFGQFNPQLGDGRAHLLGEVVDQNNQIQELQLKGSGQTPFSRNGDGKCGIKPAVREYLMSEAMYALGVPTTRSLAVITTGESIFRQSSTPGAVVTRVASSHLRFGTFEYFAARGMHDELNVLVDFAIDRHYPEVDKKDNTKYIKLISHVIDKQVNLIVNWFRVGFIHGVMNTDNTLLSGDTIDYGPCAMMGVYDPATVFSSIDHQGRYAYGNQAWITQWNLARFAETMIPLIADGGDEAIQIVTPLIEAYTEKYQRAFDLMMANKLGFQSSSEAVVKLSKQLLEIMHKKQLDYTQTFTELTNSATHADLNSDHNNQNTMTQSLHHWTETWQHLLAQESQSQTAVTTLMQKNNPLVIPRNHHVEAVLTDIEKSFNTNSVNDFLEVLRAPYSMTKNTADYQDHDPQSDLNYQTFCGT